MPQAVLHLERHLKAAQSKRPGWAAGLWGEAGVGKTFTVQSLLRESPIHSLSLHATVPLPTLAQSLRRSSKPPLWAEHILKRQAQNQAVEPQSLLDALAATLAHLAPLVLHLEDLHEANQERLDFIQKLARMVPRLRGVGLLVTSRSEPPEPFKGYRLEPLSKPESDELLEAQASNKLPAEGLEYVFAKALGNPLFTLEFWRYLTRQGFFWSDGKSWQWRKPPEDFVPVSIEALISHLLSGIADAAARQVLEARAILPHEVAPEVWAVVAGQGPEIFSQARTTIENRGILHGSNFSHPLIPEVIRHELPLAKRREYAERALQAFDPLDPLLAAEFIDDAGIEPAQATQRLEQAARQLRASANHRAAAHLLARAAQHTIGEHQASLALEAAAWFEGVDVVQSERMARLAVGSPAQHEAALLILARALLNGAKTTELGELLQVLSPHQQSNLEWWQMRLLYHYRLDHRPQKVLELWQQQPEFQALASGEVIKAVIARLSEVGDQGLAQQVSEAGFKRSDLGLVERATVLDGQNMLLFEQAKYEQIEENLNQILLWLEEKTYPLECAIYLKNRSIVRTRMGRHPQARADIERACVLYLSTGAINRYVSLQTTLGLSLIYAEEFPRAEQVLLESVRLSQQHDPSILFDCYGHLSFLYLRWGQPHGAVLTLHYARLGLGAARQRGGDWALEAALEDRVRAELGCNNPQSALVYAREIEQIAQRTGLEAYRLASLSLLGRVYVALGDSQTAIPYLHQASELYEANQQISEALSTALEIDRLENNVDRAKAKLKWFETHGHPNYAQKVRRYFPQLGDAPLSQGDAQPSQAAKAPENLRIQVLGTPVLVHSGQAVTFKAKKRLEILGYLLEARAAGKTEVSVFELADTLYPETSEKEAKASLKQLIYLIRTGLGGEVIQSTPNGYTLGAVDSDIEDFLKTGDARLWRGPYLHGLGEGWNPNLRDRLLAGLHSKAEALLEDQPIEAARLGQIWLEMEPYDPAALLLTVQAWQAAANPKTALRIYQHGQQRFQEVGETLPETLEEFLELREQRAKSRELRAES